MDSYLSVRVHYRDAVREYSIISVANAISQQADLCKTHSFPYLLTHRMRRVNTTGNCSMK